MADLKETEINGNLRVTGKIKASILEAKLPVNPEDKSEINIWIETGE